MQNQVLFNPLAHSFSLVCHIPPRLPEASTTPHLLGFSLCNTHSESTLATFSVFAPFFSLAPFLIMTFHAFASSQGWALHCFLSEGNSILKMGYGVVQSYTLDERSMQRQIKQSQFQDSSLVRETYKSKYKVSQGSKIIQPPAKPWDHLSFIWSFTQFHPADCSLLSQTLQRRLSQDKTHKGRTCYHESATLGGCTKEVNTCFCPLSETREWALAHQGHPCRQSSLLENTIQEALPSQAGI